MKDSSTSDVVSQDPVVPPAEIKVVAIDLDGTLLDNRKQVDEETAFSLRKLAYRGIHVVIASARPPRSVRPIFAQLELETLEINYNGALIWDEATRTPWFHLPMKAALVQQIVETARDMFDEVQVSCEILDQWYTDHFDPAHTTETGRLFKPDVITPLARFAHLDVTKLMLLGEPYMMLKLESLIAQTFEDLITVVRTDDDLIQIMDRRVSKARAVEQVAQHYGCTLDNVLAIGDAPNDYGMIASAGIGVAMGNAHPLVKEVARWVAPTNNEQGVLAALRRFGLA